MKHEAKHATEQPFKCSFCPASFRTRSNHKQHEARHKGTISRDHVCPTCSARFAVPSKLKRHMECHAEPLRCTFEGCELLFRSSFALKRHLTLHSDDYMQFNCDECGSTFRRRYQLDEHMRKHTGERPFACDLCPSRFAQPGALKVHKRVHTGEKPYVCPACGRAFSQKGALDRHKLIHDRAAGLTAAGLASYPQ